MSWIIIVFVIIRIIIAHQPYSTTYNFSIRKGIASPVRKSMACHPLLRKSGSTSPRILRPSLICGRYGNSHFGNRCPAPLALTKYSNLWRDLSDFKFPIPRRPDCIYIRDIPGTVLSNVILRCLPPNTAMSQQSPGTNSRKYPFFVELASEVLAYISAPSTTTCSPFP